MPYQTLLRDIYQKLQKLVNEHEQLKKENQRLRKELAIKESAEKSARDELRLLQEQVAILKSTGSKVGETEKKELEQRINQYLREIDKAIAILSE